MATDTNPTTAARQAADKERTMKAKDYAKLYQQNQSIETLSEIMTGFLREVAELIQVRNVKTNGGAVAILDEQENKWKAFCRYCPDVRPELFGEFIRHDNPEAYRVWKATGDR